MKTERKKQYPICEIESCGEPITEMRNSDNQMAIIRKGNKWYADLHAKGYAKGYKGEKWIESRIKKAIGNLRICKKHTKEFLDFPIRPYNQQKEEWERELIECGDDDEKFRRKFKRILILISLEEKAEERKE